MSESLNRNVQVSCLKHGDVSNIPPNRFAIRLVLLSFSALQNVGIVPKSTSPQRIRDNTDCLNEQLTDDHVKQLTSIDKARCFRITPWLVV